MKAYDREDHVQWGTLAELVGVPVRWVARKPPELSWAEAGALPLAGLTAYQCVLGGGHRPGRHRRRPRRIGRGGHPGVPPGQLTKPDRVHELAGRYIFVRPSAEQLAELGRLAAEGSLRIHVREIFPFGRAVDGLARVEEGRGPGKVAVLF